MEKTIYFCKKWAFSHREAIGLLTPKQALALHQKGKCYSILVDSNTRPSCVVDVFEHKDNELKFIDVSFLDGLLRRYLIYWHIGQKRCYFREPVCYRTKKVLLITRDREIIFNKANLICHPHAVMALQMPL